MDGGGGIGGMGWLGGLGRMEEGGLGFMGIRFGVWVTGPCFGLYEYVNVIYACRCLQNIIGTTSKKPFHFP